MSSMPWMKFYPRDWLTDPGVRALPLATRMVWFEMLMLMHEAEPRGYLVMNGKPMPTTVLARLIGEPVDEVERHLSLMEDLGVFSRTRNGTIYSRRMVRDEKSAEISRKNGKRGGNPNLCRKKEIPIQDNPPVGDGIKLDIRSQIQRENPPRTESESVAAPAPDRSPELVVLAAMGWDFVQSVGRKPKDCHLIPQWIADGFDLDLDILPVVSRLAAEREKVGDRVTSMRFFAAAIARHHEARLAGAAVNALRAADVPKRSDDPWTWTEAERVRGGVQAHPAVPPGTDLDRAPPEVRSAVAECDAAIEVYVRAKLDPAFRARLEGSGFAIATDRWDPGGSIDITLDRVKFWIGRVREIGAHALIGESPPNSRAA